MIKRTPTNFPRGSPRRRAYRNTRETLQQLDLTLHTVYNNRLAGMIAVLAMMPDYAGKFDFRGDQSPFAVSTTRDVAVFMH